VGVGDIMHEPAGKAEFTIGVITPNRRDLGRLREEKKKVAYRITGSLIRSEAIDPDLPRETDRVRRCAGRWGCP